MVGGGRLTIKTANVCCDASSPKSIADTLVEGRYVMVSITDTGCGMAPKLLEEIYEPFFTTKGVGRGTGLGLSMVEGRRSKAS